jgi:GntR family transcriptional repressor for pyruvate dehydrogenase complex
MARRQDLFDTTVTREHLSEQVATKIQDLITSGQLQIGDRLPSGQQMAQQMGVSRTVIREAIKTLEEKGLVRTVTGSGTYVSRVDPNTLSDSISLLIQQHGSSFEHFYEFRRILEVEIAALAAARATPEDVLSLERAVECTKEIAAQIQTDPDRSEDFVQADLEFHNLLARATHNPLLLVVQEVAPEQLLDFIRLTARAEGAVEKTLDDHERILGAVKTRDTKRCRQLMKEHIDRGMLELGGLSS